MHLLNRKKFFLYLALYSFGCIDMVLANASADFSRMSYNSLWKVIEEQSSTNTVYIESAELPKRKLTLKDLLTRPITIYQAAVNSLKNSGELFNERTTKLIRPNGICLAGEWLITENTPYSGFFKQGSRGLIIARASVGFDETEVGQYRSFGLAGKVFPTTNPDEKIQTGSFFLIDDNAGTLSKHFTRVDLLSHAKLSISHIAYQLWEDLSPRFYKLLSTIKDAQKKADSHYQVRQLYPISRMNEPFPDRVVTPALMKVTGSRKFTEVSRLDFREELRVTNYPNWSAKGENEPSHFLEFDIYVAPVDSKKPTWTPKPIGHLKFTEDVVSDNCDERLRFTHPIWDKNAT